MKIKLNIILLLTFISISAFAESSNFVFIDDYLVKWDKFAQGDNSLVPYLKKNKSRFLTLLTKSIEAGDKRAASRLVFYNVVQIGGTIICDSELGRASEKLLGKDFPKIDEKGKEAYFAAHLYFWWEDSKNNYSSFQLFNKWQTREFTKKTVIPLYSSSLKNVQ